MFHLETLTGHINLKDEDCETSLDWTDRLLINRQRSSFLEQLYLFSDPATLPDVSIHCPIAGALAGIPAVHVGHSAGAAHPDHDHRLLRHLQEAPVLVQLQRLPQQVVIIWSFVSDNRQ